MREFAVNFLKVVTVVLDLTDKAHVLVLEFFVLVSLVGIELVKSFLVDLVDLTNLVLQLLDLILHLLALDKQFIKLALLLVILHFYVVIQSQDVLRLRVCTVLVESKVVVRQFTLKLAHLPDQPIVLSLQLHVLIVVLVDLFDLCSELVNLLL